MKYDIFYKKYLINKNSMSSYQSDINNQNYSSDYDKSRNYTYKNKYYKYKTKYLELKNKQMIGGAGFYLRFTTGVDNITISGFSQLLKLKSSIKNKDDGNWFKISKLIDKYLNKESYHLDNSSVISVTPQELIIIKDEAIKLNIL